MNCYKPYYLLYTQRYNSSNIRVPLYLFSSSQRFSIASNSSQIASNAAKNHYICYNLLIILRLSEEILYRTTSPHSEPIITRFRLIFQYLTSFWSSKMVCRKSCEKYFCHWIPNEILFLSLISIFIDCTQLWFTEQKDLTIDFSIE